MEKIKEVFFMINFTQLVVETDKDTIEWLEKEGFDNPGNLPDDYSFSVFIVDILGWWIYGTNTTCMAASGSCGNNPIVLDFEQLKSRVRDEKLRARKWKEKVGLSELH